MCEQCAINSFSFTWDIQMDEFHFEKKKGKSELKPYGDLFEVLMIKKWSLLEAMNIV